MFQYFYNQVTLKCSELAQQSILKTPPPAFAETLGLCSCNSFSPSPYSALHLERVWGCSAACGAMGDAAARALGAPCWLSLCVLLKGSRGALRQTFKLWPIGEKSRGIKTSMQVPRKTRCSREDFGVDDSHLPPLQRKKGRFCLLCLRLGDCPACSSAAFPFFGTSQPMTRNLTVKLHF